MHIGERIEARAKELGVGASTLARKIGTSKQNVYGIFRRASLDTDLLQRLCKALEFDFFAYYSSAGSGKTLDEFRGSYTILHDEIHQLKRDLENLREKYALLSALYETETGKKVPGT